MPERVVVGIGYAFRVAYSEIVRSPRQSHTFIRVIWLRQLFVGSLNFPVAYNKDVLAIILRALSPGPVALC
jgi:hypothetical protein